MQPRPDLISIHIPIDGDWSQTTITPTHRLVPNLDGNMEVLGFHVPSRRLFLQIFNNYYRGQEDVYEPHDV